MREYDVYRNVHIFSLPLDSSSHTCTMYVFKMRLSQSNWVDCNRLLVKIIIINKKQTQRPL